MKRITSKGTFILICSISGRLVDNLGEPEYMTIVIFCDEKIKSGWFLPFNRQLLPFIVSQKYHFLFAQNKGNNHRGLNKRNKLSVIKENMHADIAQMSTSRDFSFTTTPTPSPSLPRAHCNHQSTLASQNVQKFVYFQKMLW